MKFALFYGGRSVEHDWSIAMYEHTAHHINMSGNSLEKLRAIIYLAANGEIFLYRTQGQIAPAHGDVLTRGDVIPIEDLPSVLKELGAFVFSLLQGQDGEDGQMQAIAQFFDVPGSFGSKSAAMLATDKYLQSRFVEAEFRDLSPIPTVCVDPYQLDESVPLLQSTIGAGPCVAKPNTLGGSFMTQAFRSLADFDIQAYAARLKHYDDRFLVQSRISGVEYTCGVISRDGAYDPLPVATIETPSHFFGYEQKVTPGLYNVSFCDQEAPVCGRIRQVSSRIAKLFDVHTFCRLDFIVDSNSNIHFFEMNIVPGLTAGSIFPKMLAKAGLHLLDLISFSFDNEQIRRRRELRKRKATSKTRFGRPLQALAS